MFMQLPGSTSLRAASYGVACRRPSPPRAPSTSTRPPGRCPAPRRLVEMTIELSDLVSSSHARLEHQAEHIPVSFSFSFSSLQVREFYAPTARCGRPWSPARSAITQPAVGHTVRRSPLSLRTTAVSTASVSGMRLSEIVIAMLWGTTIRCARIHVYTSRSLCSR